MARTSDNPPIQIHHVLTLNGRNGEYGGPVRVARELCTELNGRGYRTRIFSGALKNSEPTAEFGLSESFIAVKPILKKLHVSSLWSWRLFPELRKQIRMVDIVHIHFARDLIPFLAALISFFSRTPFVTQTHGMILPDQRLSTRIIDRLFTRPLINKARTNLVLTEKELSSIEEIEIKSPTRIFPNGIAVSQANNGGLNSVRRIAFCSRLDKRKGILKFIELADSFKSSGMQFEIYGPDGGELKLVLDEIDSRNLNKTLQYKGALPSGQVQSMLASIDLLVLPSRDEPFPMIILEALAVGTPVLVMPSCGFADILRNFESSFVAESEDLPGLISSFSRQNKSKFMNKSQSEILNFCESTFGIGLVVNQLENLYLQVIENVK